MSERKHRQPSLDPLMEGYLDYLLDVSRKAPGTVRDVRCTLRRVSQIMERLAPDRPLWKLELLDYLRWIEGERQVRPRRREPQQEPQPSARLSRLRLAQRPHRPQRVGWIPDQG